MTRIVLVDKFGNYGFRDSEIPRGLAGCQRADPLSCSKGRREFEMNTGKVHNSGIYRTTALCLLVKASLSQNNMLWCFFFAIAFLPKNAIQAGILYPRQSESRETLALDGIWKFAISNKSDQQKGFEEMWYQIPLHNVS